MRVSAIIPVFNGAAFLRQAIDSVLGQTYPVEEIVVIDDGSSDSSPELLKSYGDRLKVVRQKNRGVAAARNVGLGMASGDVIGFLDQDDLWPRGRTAIMVDALSSRPDIDVVAGLVEVLYERSQTRSLPQADLGTSHREGILGSLCLRREVFRTLGLLSTRVGYADDIDFYWRRREAAAKTLYLDEVSLIYRLHDHNTSSDHSATKYHFLAALHESLRRRRKSPNENKRDDSGP